ncbi:ligand-binding sensor domain-containing protein [Niabella aurantiaca]|uniref:ligand-binding sensor domain-containing protein n=1 Tax=Niabella aurantiaca TaxID=379900 RepID=UPI00037507CE|nr:two-component regulator propeller domain-containing protein [Niabella aurantiaca]
MRAVLLLILLGKVAMACSQPLLFENYSSRHGLSQNSCFSIAQDADGYMWFGTQDGLNRYDGREFKVYLPQTSEGEKLPSNYISSLFFSESENLLWIATMGGVCLYVPAGDSLAAIDELFPFAKPLKTVAVKKITSFTPDEYWVVTFNKGLIYLNVKTRTLRTYFAQNSYRHQVSSVVSHRGKIIAATQHTLFELRRAGDDFQPEPLLPAYHFPEIKDLYSFNSSLWVGTLTGGCYYIEAPMAQVSNIKHFETGAGGIGCFAADAEGNLWIGSRGFGIMRYSPAAGRLIKAVHNPYDNRSPGKNFVLSLYKGREGIIWCGLSGSGLAKYDPLKYQIHTIQNEAKEPASLPDNMVFDIFKSSGGVYYAGTQNKGIVQWDRKKGTFSQFPGTSVFGTSANTIYDITEDKQKSLWIASWAGLMELNPKTRKIVYHTGDKNLPSEKFYAVAKLRNADSLFLTGEDGAVFFSLKNHRWLPCPGQIFQNNLFIGRYIYEDSANVLWICTTGAGLIKYDINAQSFEIAEPVRQISVNARHLLPDGGLFWIATDNGVVVYDREHKKAVAHILPGSKNSSKVCYAVQKDKNGAVWVSANTGLYRINPYTFRVEKNYNLGNGLSFLEYNTACAVTGEDGMLLFGGIGGITEFNPLLLKENTFSPAPIITGIKINEMPLHALKSSIDPGLVLKYNENFITISFAATNFSNEANNLFSWRLEGLNDNWSTPAPTNYATFSSLPSGDYRFELRSANSDGKWAAAVTSIPITIHPPWWQTWAFRIAVAVLCAGFIFFLVNRRARVIRRDAALKQQLAELEMKGLHAQMNPHFIFNSLNSIKEMIWNDDKTSASRYLSKFAQLIRTSLEHSRQTFITVEQCVEHLQQYLEMEKLRFDEFSYSISVDEKLDANEAKIAPMLVQPLVENAIWHGLRGKEGDRLLFIRFFGNSHKLVCEIEDNGIGIKQAMKRRQHTIRSHRSLGIINIKERLEVLNEKYNMKCTLTISDKSELTDENRNGTLAVFQLIN